MKVAILGIGLMGLPIANRLVAAGHEVHAWNRTPDKARRITGALVHDSAASAARECELLITLLSDGEAVHHVLTEGGVAQALEPGSLMVDMSSIRPDQARRHHALLSQRSVDHLDAPVSGGTLGAEQGTLAIMVGGDAHALARAQPVLGVLGRCTRVGPAGTGQLAKLANQMIVGITIGAVAEALLLCREGGADMGQVRQAISGGFADSRILQVHGQRMVDHDFAARARMTVQLKDMRNALHTARSLGLSTPITALFEGLYASGVEHGFADLDHSGLFCELERQLRAPHSSPAGDGVTPS